MIGMIGAFLFILIMSMFVYPYSLDGDRDDRSVPLHSNHVYVCLSLQLGW